MGQFGMGQPVRRVEDQRFVTGQGRYTDDISLPNQAYALVLRSPYAHATIKGIDATDALALPGALAVLTAADVKAAGLKPLMTPIKLKNRDGSPMVVVPRLLLAEDTVRYVGDAVALVIAEDLATARDMLDTVMVDYEDHPAIVETARAVEPGVPQVYPEAPGNICFDWGSGQPEAVEAAFAKAAKTARVRLINNRLISHAMEPRNAIGDIDADGRLTLYTSSQGVHDLQEVFADEVFGLPREKLRVVTPDVGGGFGTKIFPYPEQALVLLAAQKLGRPVKWTGERSDSSQADAHGRDNVTEAAVAMDADGKFLALSVDTIANLGGTLSPYGPFIPTLAGTMMLTGVYAIPCASVRVRGVFTHTAPVDAYRGAGRPEAAYVIERLVEEAARVTGLSSAEIRRRNFIPAAAMPYKTALGQTYDSGDFNQTLTEALRLGDLDGFEARRAASAAKGKLRGIGLSSYIEACAGGSPEDARLVMDAGGKVTIFIGTQSNGQGHATAYGQLAADALGLDIAEVTMVQGDTDRIRTGGGTGGSRSVPIGGVAVTRAAEALIEKGKRLAAHLLEAATADVEFAEGRFTIVGTDRSVGLTEVAAKAKAGQVPDGETPELDGDGRFKPPAATFPNGTHIVELEVDPDTGGVTLERYIVVDDFGAVVNPLMLAGQVHGGIAQGAGQALIEEAAYDPESGQLLTGSFMDYGMPRADLLPQIEFHLRNVPCTTNPLGIKGAGEAGAIGAPPAVINALIEALRPYGITHIDMPATPHKIWRAIQAAQVKAAAE
ncbi:carbon monoxide dehydrogenase [Elstera cyanobacteriorum]|uniref:Carbon monoxide dehydrogenase n=1 Tax=Elstera cyanobacteriorum TaxID=2022747 RepID=A0A255XWM0_9PROT|nr:xanthine dehydrogenase family protein molybdopterin-binding subunit [Elstera cyanobacteriorum]OYQ21417.1 carbon monoxide dehydrogenase [Elstera cyanobacteriorum]GFZ96924.1 carbon monoxide dehydrogenase [Elstera cyanobacteriorum]